MTKNALTLGALALIFGIGSFAYSASLESYGEHYFHDHAGATQTISAVDTYYNLTVWNATNSLRYITSDGTALIIQAPGTYKVDWALSFAGSGNHEYDIVAFVNEVEQGECEARRKLGNLGDVGSASSTCIIDMVAGDELTLRMEDNDNPAGDATIYAGNINAVKIE